MCVVPAKLLQLTTYYDNGDVVRSEKQQQQRTKVAANDVVNGQRPNVSFSSGLRQVIWGTKQSSVDKVMD